jgi:hypothetical protein
MKPTRYFLVMALAACSSPGMHWEKAGGNEATAKQDVEQCRTQARAEAPQPTLFPATGGASTTVTGTGGGVATPGLTLEEQREQAELEYFQRCMHGKGYSAKR